MVRCWSFVLAVGVATSSRVWAEVSPDDAAQAASLFEQGRKEITASHIDAACDTFEASLALDPQLGTRLNLASCRVQQGQWSDAYSMFADAQAEADRSGKGPRATYARDQLRALDAKLVRLHLVLTDVDAATVVVNGETIDPAKRYLARPGKLTIDVTRSGFRPFHVEKIANAGAEITVDVPSLQPVEPPKVLPTVPPKPEVTVGRFVERRHPRGPVPYLVAGAGGALLVTAGVLTLHAHSRWSMATDRRDQDGVASAQREADAATGLTVAGAVAVGVGVVLWLRLGKLERVMLAPTTNGAAIRGAF